MATRDRLRELIGRSGLSQAALARRLGVHPMWISHRLSGHSAILADDLVRLAEALEIEPAALLQPAGDAVAPTPLPGTGAASGGGGESSVAIAPPWPGPSAAHRGASEPPPRMMADYELELARVRAGEPMDDEVEALFVEYLRRRLSSAEVRAILQLVATLAEASERLD